MQEADVVTVMRHCFPDPNTRNTLTAHAPLEDPVCFIATVCFLEASS